MIILVKYIQTTLILCENVLSELAKSWINYNSPRNNLNITCLTKKTNKKKSRLPHKSNTRLQFKPIQEQKMKQSYWHVFNFKDIFLRFWACSKLQWEPLTKKRRKHGILVNCSKTGFPTNFTPKVHWWIIQEFTKEPRTTSNIRQVALSSLKITRSIRKKLQGS